MADHQLVQERYEAFISYAFDDDKVTAAAGAGWVTSFANAIKLAVEKQGTREFKVWVAKDNRHEGSTNLSEIVKKGLDQSNFLICIFSKAYLASNWCMEEIKHFLASSPGACDRVFVVDKDDAIGDLQFLAEQQQAGFLASEAKVAIDLGNEKCRTPFWTSEGTGRARTLADPFFDSERDREYYAKIQDLAASLAAAVRKQRIADKARHTAAIEPKADKVVKPSTNGVGLTAPPSFVPQIFVASVNESMRARRDRVVRFLAETVANVKVIPANPEDYRSLPDVEFRGQLQRELSAADLFVQLIGSAEANGARDLQAARIWQQTELAKQLDKKMLLWASADFEREDWLDEEKKIASLREPMRVTLPTFNAQVVEQARQVVAAREARRDAAPRSRQLVFLNAVDADLSIAREVAKNYRDRFDWLMPLEEGTASEMADSTEQGYRDSHLVLFIHRASPATWLRAQLTCYRKIRHLREERLRSLIVMKAPSRPEPAFVLEELQIVACPDGVSSQDVFTVIEQALAA